MSSSSPSGGYSRDRRQLNSGGALRNRHNNSGGYHQPSYVSASNSSSSSSTSSSSALLGWSSKVSGSSLLSRSRRSHPPHHQQQRWEPALTPSLYLVFFDRRPPAKEEVRKELLLRLDIHLEPKDVVSFQHSFLVHFSTLDDAQKVLEHGLFESPTSGCQWKFVARLARPWVWLSGLRVPHSESFEGEDRETLRTTLEELLLARVKQVQDISTPARPRVVIGSGGGFMN